MRSRDSLPFTADQKEQCRKLGISETEFRGLLAAQQQEAAEEELLALVDGEIRFVWDRHGPPREIGSICQVSNGFEFRRVTFLRWLDGSSRRAALVDADGKQMVAHDPDDAW